MSKTVKNGHYNFEPRVASHFIQLTVENSNMSGSLSHTKAPFKFILRFSSLLKRKRAFFHMWLPFKVRFVTFSFYRAQRRTRCTASGSNSLFKATSGCTSSSSGLFFLLHTYFLSSSDVELVVQALRQPTLNNKAGGRQILESFHI